MAVNYEVGDKIRVLNAEMINPAVVTNGNVYEITQKLNDDCFDIVDDEGDDVAICKIEYDYIEKVLEPTAPQFKGFVNLQRVKTLGNGNLLITLECDETVNMALIKAERDVYERKQARKAEIKTEIAQLQRELEELQ